MNNLLQLIADVFSYQSRPSTLIGSAQLTDDELQDVLSFTEYAWDNLTGDILEKYFDVISYLTPEAYRYYLPGIMKSSVAECEPNLILVHNIITSLDRTPNPNYWDDFFFQRWANFSEAEYEVFEGWIVWLSSYSKDSSFHDSYGRSLDTLGLLKRYVNKNNNDIQSKNW